MADYSVQLGDFPSKLALSKRILLALPKNLSVDSLASALAMALSLQKMGKTVSVVSEGTPLVSHSHLYGIGDVKNSVPTSGEGNFVIKLDGVVDPSGQMNTVPALEKLDWNPEGSALNLVFHVVPGQRFEPTNVSYGHETSGFDLIITVDADSLDELGQIYLKNAALFSKSTVINIDNDPSNSQFGNINIVDPQASSLSEMTVQILKQLEAEMDSDIASNLVAGIYSATHNLTQNVNPDTFAAVATAMQAGGKLPEGGVVSESSVVSGSTSSPLSPQSLASTAPQVEPVMQPVVEAPVAQETNQIQFNAKDEHQAPLSQPTSDGQQSTAIPASVVEAPVTAQSVQESVAPADSMDSVASPQAISPQANDLYNNPFLNPGGQPFGQPTTVSDQSLADSTISSQANPAPQMSAAPVNDPFGAPASGPTFNFGSFGDSQPIADNQQHTANSAPQFPVAPAPVVPEQVDVSGPLSTIMQAKQKDDAYDLKQIFNVEQMPETPTSANTTLDSAVQRTQATIEAQQPAASQAVLQQQAAGQTQVSSQPTPATQPIQDSKPQSSPEERPAGEATTSTNPEVEANPTPDWLVPKIFKGGSLG
jgi:hypothetical protein